MTSGSATRRAHESQHPSVDDSQRSHSTLRIVVIIVGVAAVIGLIAAALISARPEVSNDVSAAPNFTLPASDGSTFTLAEEAGTPVLLYFNEGAGCDACIQQMAAIEQDPAFADAGIKVVPIVMNTAEQINAERERLGVSAPFLMDDGKVSAAYGTLGTGMHAGLPGHGFVLINADGQQVWSGDYPSMWIEPSELFTLVEEALA